VLAVVATMVGLVVAALPAAPAAAATSQTLVPWGDHLRQAFVPTGLSGVTGIAAGGDHGLLVHGDGTVGAWGANNNGQTNVPSGLSEVRSIDADFGYALALKADGTVVAWGTLANGVTSVPDGLDHVTAIAAGGSDSIALVSGASTPLTTIACRDISSCSTGWYGTEPVTGWWGSSPVNVNLYLYATAGSAVAKTVYTLDGSDPATSDTAITYTHPPDTLKGYVELGYLASTTTVRFFSIDAAGHIEPTRSQLIQIELVPPTTTISCNGGPCGDAAYSSAVTVALSATDAGGSGVAKTVYTTDGSPPLSYSSSAKTYTGPFTVSSTTTVRYSSTDAAGNVEPGKSQLIQISKVPTTGSIVLAPTDDTYTAKGDPAVPHGAEATLKVNSGARERRTYVRFHLDAIPAGATGITASLRLYASSDASASVRFTVSQVATGWSEATLTWNTQPAVGATVGSKAGVVGGAYNSVEVSSLVGGNGTYAMVVTDNSTAQRSFASKESSLNSRRSWWCHGPTPASRATPPHARGRRGGFRAALPICQLAVRQILLGPIVAQHRGTIWHTCSAVTAGDGL
jgi:Chitobiase/beta-hexosaminidase C-terminal domain